jgi:hypothetical protein
VHITDAPYAVDQEDLLEKLVFAEFVSGNLHHKANCRVLPNQVGNQQILYLKIISADFKEILKWQVVIQLQTC